MKKQIAVLMAAATAVTTVAPAIANADVNTQDASAAKIVADVRKALNDKYTNKNANGVTVPTGSALSDDFLNSKYIVLVHGATNGITDSGFKKFAESAYSEKNLKEVYGVEVKEGNDEKTIYNNKDESWYVVDDASKLGNLLEKNLGKSVQVAIVDKGSKDGSSIRETTNKHYVSSIKEDGKEVYENDQAVSLKVTADKLIKMARTDSDKDRATFVDWIKLNGEGNKYVNDKKIVKNAPDNVTKIEIKLTSGEEYTLEVNDDAFNLNKGLDKDDAEFKLFNEAGDPVVTQDVMDKITSFKTIENKDDKKVELDLPNGDTEQYTLQDVTEEVIELKDIYTREDGYNAVGKDFVNGLVEAKKAPYKFNFRGVNYILGRNVNSTVPKAVANPTEAANAIHTESAKIDKDGNGYKLTIDVDVIDANDDKVGKTLEFVIKGDKQKDLADVLRDLKGSEKVVAGHFTKLAGENRYATAIAVSEEQFDADEADSVVIVGGKAQLDGLSAAPLASAKNAPILLADPTNGLSKETLAEIDRACDNLNKKTVYIVGGEKSVPKSVEKQLEDKFNAVVVRVSGTNRVATSLEVARRLSYDNNLDTEGRLFLVGRDGAADAMSASSVAANVHFASNEKDSEKKISDRKVSPILVVEKNGIDRVTREFLERDVKAKNIYLVGGENSLATQVLKDAGLVGATSTERISGDNRYDTNFEFIKRFFMKDDKSDNVFGEDNEDNNKVKIFERGMIYASGDNKYLVDSQTAGSFAAQNNLPIILTGDKLTSDQVDMLKKNGLLENQRTNVYQVGGVVSSEVMKVVVDKLDL